MSIFDALEISASGLTANRAWMDVIADNIANASTTRTAEGGPYRRRDVVFGTVLASSSPSTGEGQGVRVVGIVEDTSPLKLEYNPGHPDANADGYVQLPNVNPVTEMVDMMVASRAYEANATAIESAKAMVGRMIDILK